MTRLLVSVRDAAEARLALAAGVDLIDVKEPRRGGLGRADATAIRAVVRVVERNEHAQRPPVSVALGELLEDQAHDDRLDLAGVRFAKLGLAGCAAIADWPARWASALDRCPATVGRVAVVYADWQTARSPRPGETLAYAEKCNCRAVLVDTFDKTAGSLIDHWSGEQLENFLREAKSLGLMTVVGGGLKRANLRTILPMNPDYVAVRGAACRGDRSNSICPQHLAALVELVRGTASDRSRRQSGRGPKAATSSDRR